MKFNIFKRERKNTNIDELLKQIADELISQKKLADIEKALHDYIDKYTSSLNPDADILSKLNDCEDLIQKLQTISSGDIRTGLYNFLKKLNECDCLEEVVEKVVNYKQPQSSETNESKSSKSFISNYREKRRNEKAGYWLYRYLIAFQNIKLDHDNDFENDFLGGRVLSKVAAEKVTVGLLKKWQKAAKKLPSAFSKVGLTSKTTAEEINNMQYDDDAKKLISSIVASLKFQAFDLNEREVKKAKSSSPYISLFKERNLRSKMQVLSSNCVEADLLREAMKNNDAYINVVAQYHKKRRRVIRTRFVLAGLGIASIFRLGVSNSSKKAVHPKNTTATQYESQTNTQVKPDIEILSVGGKDLTEQVTTEHKENVTIEPESLMQNNLENQPVQDSKVGLDSMNQVLEYYEDVYEEQDTVLPEQSITLPEETDLTSEIEVTSNYVDEIKTETEENGKEIIEVNQGGNSKELNSQVTVQAGDTLAKIAREQLGDESRYKEIAELNGLQNPDEIEIGQVLTIPSTSLKSELEGYKEKLETLKEQLPQSSVVLDNEMSIGDCFSTTNHTIYSDEYSLCYGENGRPSYFQGTLPDMVKSYVMTDGKDIIQVKTMEEAAALMDMGYTVKGYAALNPTSQSVADVEGFFRSENVKKLSL